MIAAGWLTDADQGLKLLDPLNINVADPGMQLGRRRRVLVDRCDLIDQILFLGLQKAQSSPDGGNFACPADDGVDSAFDRARDFAQSPFSRAPAISRDGCEPIPFGMIGPNERADGLRRQQAFAQACQHPRLNIGPVDVAAVATDRRALLPVAGAGKAVRALGGVAAATAAAKDQAA